SRRAKLIRRASVISAFPDQTQIRRRRIGALLAPLIMQLLDYLLQACFATGVGLTVLGLDAAAAGQQLVVLQQAPALLMALADGPDGFEIGGIEIDADLLGSHGQRLERTAQDLTDLAGVAVQLALHHLVH